MPIVVGNSLGFGYGDVGGPNIALAIGDRAGARRRRSVRRLAFAFAFAFAFAYDRVFLTTRIRYTVARATHRRPSTRSPAAPKDPVPERSSGS